MMKTAVLLLAVLGASAALASADNYAVLICGSHTYPNYRHHADVCHAYQILIKNGVPAENIITFLYDDVANDPENPYPGQLFNKPTPNSMGVDVYKGCVKDYTGADVIADNVMSVLKGDAAAMKGKGTGRVLKSGPNDHVFINFVDHGAQGLVAMPTGPYWYKDQLDQTLTAMQNAKMYKQLVFYLEACESGSMFQGLSASTNIFATTAANADESSWGTYCPPDDIVDSKNLNTCLGDLYSVNWMENSDIKKNMGTESLQKQFKVVQQETNKSHVCEFGDMAFDAEDIDQFQGDVSASPALALAEAVAGKPVRVIKASEAAAVSSRDAVLAHLRAKEMRAAPEAKAAATLAVHAELDARKRADVAFTAMAEATFGKALDLGAPVASYTAAAQWDCYRGLNDAIEAACGRYTDYSLKYARVAYAMCGHTANVEAHVGTVRAACSWN